VVRVAPAGTVLAGPAERAYDLVLVDPPYDVPDAEVAGWLVAAAAHGWLAAGAVVVVERSARGAPFPWPPPLRALRERRYGETTLFLAELAGPVTWAVSVRG
jgi:16S rRNA (guanine966-N2)-methyltransferase